MTDMCDISTISLPVDNNNSFNMTNNVMSQNSQEEKAVLDAAQLSYQTGSMIPILKQELRYSILIRRVSEGKSEFEAEYKPVTSNQLTDYEIEKKKRRREQNRRAAMKFRQKNRNKSTVLTKEIETLQKENEKLRKLRGDLTIERDNLMDRIKEHFQFCNFRPLQINLDMLVTRN